MHIDLQHVCACVCEEKIGQYLSCLRWSPSPPWQHINVAVLIKQCLSNMLMLQAVYLCQQFVLLMQMLQAVLSQH